MAETALRNADPQTTANIIRSCEVDDEYSFSFCALSENIETARLLASTTEDHFGAFASCPAQQRGKSKESPTPHALSTDQHGSCFRQNSTQMSGSRKHSKSFGRDEELAVLGASLLSSSKSCELDKVCPADELFYKGELLPLYSHYSTHMFQGMVSFPQFQAERELLGTPPRSSSDTVDQFSSSFWPDSPIRIEQPLRRAVRSNDTPQLESPIIQRLQQPALIRLDLHNTSSDDGVAKTLSHRRPAFQNRRSSSNLDPTFWCSSENTSPTKDLKRKGYNSSAHSCLATPDHDYCQQRGKDDRRSAKKPQRSSKAIALAYWHKSVRMLLKPLDRLHSKDTDQSWDASISRTVWFSDCKETGTAIANSVHHIRTDHSSQIPKHSNHSRRDPDPFLRSNQPPPTSAGRTRSGVEANGARQQNNMYKRAELHIGIEGAIAHCKQSQQVRR